MNRCRRIEIPFNPSKFTGQPSIRPAIQLSSSIGNDDDDSFFWARAFVLFPFRIFLGPVLLPSPPPSRPLPTCAPGAPKIPVALFSHSNALWSGLTSPRINRLTSVSRNFPTTTTTWKISNDYCEENLLELQKYVVGFRVAAGGAGRGGQAMEPGVACGRAGGNANAGLGVRFFIR